MSYQLSDPTGIRASCLIVQQSPGAHYRWSSLDYMHIPKPGWTNSPPDYSNVGASPHVPQEPKVEEEVFHHRKLRYHYKNGG